MNTLLWGLTNKEISWMRTLNLVAIEAISQTAPTADSPRFVTAPTSPSWSVPSSPNSVTAPSSPTWEGLPAIPRGKEMTAHERVMRNRKHASLSRQRKKAYGQEIQKRIATIEAENAALRAEVERELSENKRLKQTLGLDSADADDSMWV
jgi:hypothetical protein